ncbi:MAG TPA: hypothetical protein VJS66_02085 [Burkholderiales bacterium]|nr:hypothetical protein [Burkholderiales bacterium]
MTDKQRVQDRQRQLIEMMRQFCRRHIDTEYDAELSTEHMKQRNPFVRMETSDGFLVIRES